MGRLDYGFERAEQFGLACCMSENPWARRHRGLRDAGDMVEYHTGVIFFTRQAKPVFDRWCELAPTLDSVVVYSSQEKLMRSPPDDQASFTLAVAECGFNPFVLPFNWNFRPCRHGRLYGPIKIYHDYPDLDENIRRWSDEQAKPNVILGDVELVRETGP
jgi:hypothetical protein